MIWDFIIGFFSPMVGQSNPSVWLIVVVSAEIRALVFTCLVESNGRLRSTIGLCICSFALKRVGGS